MTKPEDIPQAIWSKAEAAYAEGQMRSMHSGDPMGPAIIALAILSAVDEEREECAKLVETFGPQDYYNRHGQERYMSEIEYALSQAIRSRK